MRKLRTVQATIFDVFCAHQIGRELKGMSDWLDRHGEILSWVAGDLRRGEVKATGRCGLTVDS